MTYSRALFYFFAAFLLSAVVLQATAQSNSTRRGGTNIPQAATATHNNDETMYEKARANAESVYEGIAKDYKEKYTPALIQTELAYSKQIFKEENGREPNKNDLQNLLMEAEEKAKQQESIALKAQRDGMEKSLAKYAAYQNEQKENQQAKLDKMQADNEAIGLPADLDGMFVVMSNGMVFSVVNRSDHDRYYPYKLYVESLSGLSREAGRSVGEMMAKARYNYRTQSFDYKEALDYTKSFDIQLNYELVKQGCGTIYSNEDISFKFQALGAQPDAFSQWRAESEGTICPYLDMDYANCRVKRCLKRMPYKETITVLKGRSEAMALGKKHFTQTEKIRKSYAERMAELAGIVDTVNASSQQKERQDSRSKCPRALCEDTVINQFIIDQTWGRSANEKPAF